MGEQFQRAVTLWVLAKHNKHNKSVVDRLFGPEQITHIYFEAEEGVRYSEYTMDSPSVLVSYTYIDNIGKIHSGSIDIEGQSVGPFVAEIAALA